MALTKDEIRAAVLQLEPADREALVEELLFCISDQEREEIERAWIEEAHRRLADYRAGRADAKPMEEFLAELERKYAS